MDNIYNAINVPRLGIMVQCSYFFFSIKFQNQMCIQIKKFSKMIDIKECFYNGGHHKYLCKVGNPQKINSISLYHWDSVTVT